jgi:cytochrome c
MRKLLLLVLGVASIALFAVSCQQKPAEQPAGEQQPAEQQQPADEQQQPADEQQQPTGEQQQQQQ